MADMPDEPAMSDDPAAVASHTLKLLRGLRRDHAAVIERQSQLLKAITSVQHAVSALARETRDGFNTIHSDVISLENQNFSRHGELLNVMRRLDELELPAG